MAFLAAFVGLGVMFWVLIQNEYVPKPSSRPIIVKGFIMGAGSTAFLLALPTLLFG